MKQNDKKRDATPNDPFAMRVWMKDKQTDRQIETTKIQDEIGAIKHKMSK